jgi:hypothetical protein
MLGNQLIILKIGKSIQYFPDFSCNKLYLKPNHW